MKYILSHLKLYSLRIILLMIVKIIGTVADLVLPFLLAYMIDDLIHQVDTTNYDSLLYLGVIMFLIAVVGCLFNMAANRSAEYVASYAVSDIRNELFHKIEYLSAPQVDSITTTSLISRMTTDTYNIFSFIGMVQRLGVRAPILLVGGIIMSFFLDPILALIMVAMLPLIGYITYRTTKKGQPLYKDIQKQVDQVIRTLRENITGARVVRALSMTNYEKQRFDKENLKAVEKELKATMTMAKIRPFVDIIMNIGLVIVLVVGAYRIATNHTRPGDIIALVTYFTLISNAMMSVTRIFIQTSRATASSARIKEVLDFETVDLESGDDLIVNKNLPHLVFDQVSFSYHDDANQLENISFELYKGQTLGIIGATGSGKTTLINLLLKFYKPQKGNIKVYGQDINDIKTKALRRHMGLVLQNDLIFSETIYENIHFSRENILPEDVEFASNIAQANFIRTMPDGYKHYLSQRGTNISGGQRQRVLIARALAGKPDLLILDDASSALDYQTDMKLRQAIKKHLEKTTKVIIAQRISSVKDADLIILIEDGKITASGKHEDLMTTSSQYRLLSSYQLGEVAE